MYTVLLYTNKTLEQWSCKHLRKVQSHNVCKQLKHNSAYSDLSDYNNRIDGIESIASATLQATTRTLRGKVVQNIAVNGLEQ